jgi:AcrR family transcriptional regulator
MTIYHYVPSKRDLLALMEDQGYVELLVPEGERASNWRDAVAELGRRMRTALQRRPWAVTSLGQGRLGPNGMRVFEQTLSALADLPLSPAEKMELIALVHDYALGFALHASLAATVGDGARNDIADDIAAQLESGRFPQVQHLVEEAGGERAFIRGLDAATAADERFERGLRRLLDGFEAELVAR